jgi:hypothetical protein
MKGVSPKLGRVGSAVSLVVVAACGTSPLTAEELAPVVERDAVPIPGPEIPAKVLDLLDDYEVVVVGETHLIGEQREFTAAVVRGMHDRGVRQLLLEWPHFADWVVDNYVMDGPIDDPWQPPLWGYGDLMTAIRDFNRSLPEEERVHVRLIDANLDNYGGASEFRASIRGLTRHLGGASPIDDLLVAEYESPTAQTVALETAREELSAQRPELEAQWGEASYEMVDEMVEVELASVEIRSLGSSEMAARAREPEIMRLTDLRLSEEEGGSVINIGGNHAQKKRIRGTDHEWLGDYLVHRSPQAGSVIVLGCFPALVVSSGGATIDYDLMDESPEHELLRIMSETWPDVVVFLALDDVVFGSGVSINIEGRITTGALGETYDAVVLLPVGHQIPLPS